MRSTRSDNGTTGLPGEDHSSRVVYHATVIAKALKGFATDANRSHRAFRGFGQPLPAVVYHTIVIANGFFLEFFLARQADVRNKPRIGGTEVLEIAASFAEA